MASQTEIYTVAARRFVEEVWKSKDAKIDWLRFAYCAGKLNGEAGEVAELVFKALRDGKPAGYMEPDRLLELKKELGDVLWYVSQLAKLAGFGLEEVMEDNIKKLADRKERGVLTGSGDNR